MDVTADAEGNTVVHEDGRQIGVVTRVTNGTAFVEPVADLESAVRSELGWAGDDREEYRLDGGRIETVTQGEIWLGEPPERSV